MLRRSTEAGPTTQRKSGKYGHAMAMSRRSKREGKLADCHRRCFLIRLYFAELRECGGCLVDKIGALGKIFIAGTGRCDTTILHAILGRHPQAYRILSESKFIVEGDGLNALLPRLHADFSVTASDLALIRFIEMMNEDTHQFSSLLGAQYYFPPLQEYIDNLTDFIYDGRPFPKMFECRGELIAVTRHFVSTMFGAPTLNAGKRFSVEKTPSN